jgi:hypothetical protein
MQTGFESANQLMKLEHVETCITIVTILASSSWSVIKRRFANRHFADFSRYGDNIDSTLSALRGSRLSDHQVFVDFAAAVTHRVMFNCLLSH